jgi:hypothetical protein
MQQFASTLGIPARAAFIATHLKAIVISCWFLNMHRSLATLLGTCSVLETLVLNTLFNILLPPSLSQTDSSTLTSPIRRLCYQSAARSYPGDRDFLPSNPQLWRTLTHLGITFAPDWISGTDPALSPLDSVLPSSRLTHLSIVFGTTHDTTQELTDFLSSIITACPNTLKAAIFLLKPTTIAALDRVDFEEWVFSARAIEAVVMGTVWPDDGVLREYPYFIQRHHDDFLLDWCEDLEGRNGPSIWELAEEALKQRREQLSL